MSNAGNEMLLIVPIVLSVSLLIIILLVTMTVNYTNYKYYELTYNAIVTCRYVMVRNGYDIQYYHRPEEPNPYSNDEILFFLERGKVCSIKLLSRGLNYIHDRGGWDLYSRYWFNKILKARDKYNHQLWVSTQPQRREFITGSIEHREPFKFLQR